MRIRILELVAMLVFTLATYSVFATEAIFNSETGVLSLPIVNVPGTGVVDATLNLTNTDPIEFTLHSATFYSTPPVLDELSVQVQNGSVLYIPRVQVGSEFYELNMSLLNGNPIIFGNLQVLSVSNVPAPVPDPLETSINNGQAVYTQLCSVCHGVSGSGTAAGPSVLIGNTASFESLRIQVNNSMPVGNTGSCVDSSTSSCATDVSNYIISRLR